jgi:hypothetical protein
LRWSTRLGLTEIWAFATFAAGLGRCKAHNHNITLTRIEKKIREKRERERERERKEGGYVLVFLEGVYIYRERGDKD